MHNCMQTPTISTLQHGILCFSYYLDLLQILSGKVSLYDLQLPDLFMVEAKNLLTHQLPLETMMSALIYHDCGKYICQSEDEQGVHFRNHAATSAELYAHLFSDVDAKWLISNDMLLHTCTAEELAAVIPKTVPEYLTSLLLGSYAELHANAQQFGGRDSTNFKIKLKHLTKRCNQILREVHYV